MNKSALPSILILLCLSVPCRAVFHEVPGDFATIGEALYYSGQSDTILVHPGVYRERLIMPGHDFLLASEFYFTHDSSALYNTVIDASDFAEEDTASVLTFFNGNSRATVVSGFTLRGGHGFAPEGGFGTGGAIYIEESHPTILSNIITGNQAVNDVGILAVSAHPRIAQNLIYDNCGMGSVMSVFQYSSLDEMALIEWNDIAQNWGCYYPEWPYLAGSMVYVVGCGAVIRFNRFHDYFGNFSLGVHFYGAWGELLGNRFERLTCVHFEGTQDDGLVVHLYHSRVTVRDNLFQDCSVENPALMITNRPLQAPRMIERNWFENIQSSGVAGAAGLNIIEPSGTIRDNVFIRCTGPLGAIGLSFFSEGTQGCQATIEGNHFFFNHTLQIPERGSALVAVGTGDAMCTLRDNWFEGNGGFAVEHEHYPNPLEWDCRNNYWGDPSGPYHSTLNPEGRGDTVGDHILFDPWLTEPPTSSSAPFSPFALTAQDWKLEGAFPNPFNSATQIRLISSRPQPFEVMVYNLLGQRVRRLWRGIVPKDTPVSVIWDGRDEAGQTVATGLYFIVATSRLSTSSGFKTCKVLCLR